MMDNNRKVILYIAMSLDGFIAGPNDDLGFLDIVRKEDEDYGYSDFIKTIDTVILGRKTFDWVMKHAGVFPHPDKNCFIITRSTKQIGNNSNYYSGDLKELVLHLKNEPGKNILIDGGAEIVNILLKDSLIDEFIISVIPVLVGDGTRLFREGTPGQRLHLVSVNKFDTGLVQLYYKRYIGRK